MNRLGTQEMHQPGPAAPHVQILRTSGGEAVATSATRAGADGEPGRYCVRARGQGVQLLLELRARGDRAVPYPDCLTQISSMSSTATCR